ncbi:TMEM165/GDT1 family protein [Candidatus Fermentibacteria bacterium]|nr:TMEM165/GDT1 family protein [Candidatus Fermentibacteria bacterium]
MDLKLLMTVFSTVFLAEIGDKTQLATMLYSAEGGSGSRFTVFLGSALALVVASAAGVLAGAALSKLVQGRALSLIAGMGFVAVGVWVLARG